MEKVHASVRNCTWVNLSFHLSNLPLVGSKKQLYFQKKSSKAKHRSTLWQTNTPLFFHYWSSFLVDVEFNIWLNLLWNFVRPCAVLGCNFQLKDVTPTCQTRCPTKPSPISYCTSCTSLSWSRNKESKSLVFLSQYWHWRHCLDAIYIYWSGFRCKIN